MDVAELRMFEAAARLGSINQAARELNTVQSNVTSRIRALEDELGVELLHRNRRGVTPTPAGHRMLPFVTRLQKLMADAKTAARDDGEPNGTLLLGSLETTMALRLGPTMTRFARTYPSVAMVVQTGTTQKVIEQVVAGTIDGGFVAGPVNHPDLEQETIFREELVLITPSSIRSMGDLARLPDLRTIVFQIGCSYRQRLEAVLAGLGIATAKPLEFGSLDAILGCISGGVGVTLLPKGLVAAAQREGHFAVHELPQQQGKVETLFVRRRDGYPSSALRAFLEIAKAAAISTASSEAS
jgi:DNA-binding transcriptional LysR family regulator